MQKYEPMRLSGGGARGGGNLYHALPIDTDSLGVAICGAVPGPNSWGWVSGSGSEVTCPKCLKKIAKLAKV